MTMVLAVMALQTSREVVFVYQADKELSRVNLAGTFNNWNKDAWPMKMDTDGRTWRFTANLEPGKHLYKFVLNGETWITDPKAQKNENDGGGNINSVLLLLPKGYDRPAKPGDGVVTTSTILHEQEPPYLNYDRGQLEIQLRCRPNDAERVEIWVNGKISLMKEVASDEFYARYSAKIPWDRQKSLDYLFALWDKKKGVNYGAGGLEEPGVTVPFQITPQTFKPFEVPNWVERTVLYQIFPDRFANGNPKNDPKDVAAWDAAPTYRNFFGGDFAGISQHLGYLKKLGIGGIYFNPIFEGPSNHRYETVDYLTVDHRLGTNDEFAALTKELRSSGIRTVLDGVFNHCATGFPPFKDLLEHQEESAYRNWFYVKSWPVEVRNDPPYEAFYGFPSMPKVNLLDPAASEAVLSVPKVWNERAEIAGWRLDVANEVPMAFWRRFRESVKSIRRDMWICGEDWTGGVPWLKGDQWDSVMNYPLRDAWIQFFASGGISGSECLKRMQANYYQYLPQVSRNLMTMLGSHDTPRFLTLANGNAKAMRLAATVQFGWPGAPTIYYGDELGMDGGRDPENRRGMRWDLAVDSNPMLAHYRRLVSARRNSRALQSGDPVILKTDDANRSFAFGRVLDDETAVVAVNRSDRPVSLTIDLKGKAPLTASLKKQGFDDVLGGRRIGVSPSGSVLLRLEAMSSALLVPARASATTKGSGRPTSQSAAPASGRSPLARPEAGTDRRTTRDALRP